MSDPKRHDVAYDCRYYLGDRPCTWHKQEGVICECEHYSQITGSLLIIKLDAMGDVLRTTCLLPVIDRAWPGMRLIWITRSESVTLLEGNPYLSEVLFYGPDALVHLAARTFDCVINLDAGPLSSAMAGHGKAKEKLGWEPKVRFKELVQMMVDADIKELEEMKRCQDVIRKLSRNNSKH